MRKWLVCATRSGSSGGAYDASRGLKPPFSPCNCNRHSVFFFVWLCMTRWFTANWAFLYFFLILSKFTLVIQNHRVVLLVIDISTSILLFIIISILFLGYFINFYLFSISSFNSNLWYIIFFNLVLILLIVFLSYY